MNQNIPFAQNCVIPAKAGIQQRQTPAKRTKPRYCPVSREIFNPDISLGQDAFAGAALAIATPYTARSIAAKAAPTKVILQLDDRRISPNELFGFNHLVSRFRGNDA